MGKSAAESGELEKAQALALARAAAQSSTLEHYIWSTLPSASKTSGGKAPVPHLDYKAEVDEIIRKEMPELARKTTFLFFGFYGSNMAYFPFCKPLEWVGVIPSPTYASWYIELGGNYSADNAEKPGAYGAHIWVQPIDPALTMPNAGDMTVTPGLWVSAILAQPEKTQGKYASVATETLSFAEHLAIWSEVTGKRASFVRCSYEDFVKVWGPPGEEYAMQLRWHEFVSDWADALKGDFVSMEELGIKANGVGHRGALEKIKGMGLI